MTEQGKNIIDEKVLSEEEIKENAKNKALEFLKNQKATFVNINEIAEAEARKAADARMAEDKAKLGSSALTKETKIGRIVESIKNKFGTEEGIKNTCTMMWKHTLFHEYYRQKEINKVREEIIKKDDIYTGRLNDKNAHENAMMAISERFSSEYDETLSEGEEKKTLDKENPETTKARSDIKNLINEYAKGTLGDEAFKEEKVRILNALKGESLLKGSNTYADNLFEIAKNAKLAIEHGAKIEELDFDTDIIVGKAKSSLKTEAHFNLVDKTIDKINNSKIGSIVSPALVSTAIGLAYSISVGFGKKIFRSKAMAYGTLGAAVAVSGAFAGIQKNKDLKEDRARHGISMAEGSKTKEGSEYREKIDQFQYKMENSSDLAEKLRSLMFEKDENGKDIVKDFKEEDLVNIFANLSNIEARNSLNAKNKIDLISYSKIGNVEKERTDLTILTARAKVELRKRIEGDLKGGIPEGEKDFDSYLAKLTETTENSLLDGEKGITAQDKAFSNFKTKEVAKKVAATIVIGFTIGAVVQEGVAFFKDDVHGYVEGLFNHQEGIVMNQTPIESLHGWMVGHPTHMGMGTAVETHLNGGTFKLPEGTSIIQNSDGTYDVLRGDEVVSDNVHLDFDANGNLDPESIARLGEDGIIANTAHTIVDGTKEVTVNGDQYVNNHLNNTTHVARDGWYDNNTPKPIFDQNELKLHWGGGSGGTGIDNHGNYVFNTGHMTSDGSFHNQFSVDAQEKIKSGGLKMLLSLTQGTQHQVFEVPIDANGNAVIDPNSEIGKLFFSTENGHAVFKGRFAEVVESFGSKDGTEHVKTLSTLVGPGNDSITDTIPTHIDTPITTLDPSIDTEPPMFIPVWGRKHLEKLEEEKQMAYYFGGSGVEANKSDKERYKKELSKTLKENPSATLDQFREIESYLNKQDKKYLKYLEEMANEMGPMNKDCQLSVCIPAAGHQEGEAIYTTLKNYTSQTIENNKFEIVVFVNRPEKNKQGEIINPDSTLEEIERFKKDYPEMNIKISDRVLPVENARIAWVRKTMNDAVLLRQYARGENAPELFMVSNDADNKGVAPKYIENFITKFNENKEADAMIGQLDWDPSSYIRNPLIHVGTRLMLYNGSQSRFNGWHYNSSGANFAFRSSIYAGVGGYSGDRLGGGEDTDFGAKITSSREGAVGKTPIIYAGALSSRLYTSSRRAEMAAEKGLAPIEQWDLGFSSTDNNVRKIDWESKGKKVDYTNKKEVEKLISNIEIVINRTINKSKEWNSSTKDQNLLRSLGWLGIKYEITGSHSIKITDATKLIEGLEQYQREGLALLEKKTTYIKEKRETIKKSQEKIKIEKELDVYMNKFSDNSKKIEALINLFNKSLSDDVLKKLKSNTTLSKINRQLKEIKNNDNKEDFDKKVKEILLPIIFSLEKDQKELMVFQRKAFIHSHEFIPVNEVFSYGIYKGDLHIHLAPASDLSMTEKLRLLKDALSKISKIAEANPEVKEISATSWIVVSNPGIFKKLGFKIQGNIDEKTKNQDFPGENRMIGKAFASREDFIKKYN